MSFFKLLSFDLRNGIVRVWYRYGMVFAFFVLAALALQSDSLGMRVPLESLTWGDYVLYSFFGGEEYSPSQMSPFNVPPLWLAGFLLFFYLTLAYPYEDLLGVGQRILVESKSRVLWWCSKCVWVFASAVLFYAVALLALFAVALVSGNSLAFEVTFGFIDMMTDSYRAYPLPWDIAGFLWLCFLTTVALGLLQLFLSLVAGPMPSFIAIAGVLILSAYYKVFFLPGNYLMAERNGAFLDGGIDPFLGVLISLGLVLFSVVVGLFYMQHMDVIGKGQLHD